MYRSQNVKEIMAHQGRSITWLARQLRLGRSYTGQIVNGQIDISTPLATTISLALGVPVDTLFLPASMHASMGREAVAQ